MDEEGNEQIIARNRKAESDFNIIKHRTDTEPILEKMEVYLRGSKKVYIENKDTGNISSKNIVVGSRRAFEQGVQAILGFLSNAVNQHTIQGNFPLTQKGFSQKYEDYCYDFEISLICDTMSNLQEYGIRIDEYQGIIDRSALLLRPVMSRCIDNKERESYGETTQSVESNTVKARSGFNLFAPKT